MSTINEKCRGGQKSCPNRHFLVVSRRFGHFYLLVGINLITHVVATFGIAVRGFFRKVAQRLPPQPFIRNGLVGLNYMS